MATQFPRSSLSAALVNVKFTAIPSAFSKLNFSNGLAGNQLFSVNTIARAQQISTNDSMEFYRLRQIGYGSIVEDVPGFMESSGSLSVVETVDIPSLYRLGIYDFVRYLYSCSRDAMSISILGNCVDGDSTLVSNPNQVVDTLGGVKFNAVARSISVGGGPGLVYNQASFIYIRSLNSQDYLPTNV